MPASAYLSLPAAARAESVALRSELASVQSELSNANNKLAAEQGNSECRRRRREHGHIVFFSRCFRR
jgi:hypothetical protein